MHRCFGRSNIHFEHNRISVRSKSNDKMIIYSLCKFKLNEINKNKHTLNRIIVLSSELAAFAKRDYETFANHIHSTFSAFPN